MPSRRGPRRRDPTPTPRRSCASRAATTSARPGAGGVRPALSEHTAATYHAWERARPANDFAAVRPLLEKTRRAEPRARRRSSRLRAPYDPLIDLAEDGMTVAAVRALFTELRAGLGAADRGDHARARSRRPLPRAAHSRSTEQLAFGAQVIRAFGYDFTRGRQDKTAHPFMTKSRLRRRAHHHAVRDDDLSDGAVLDAARGRPRDVRAGHRRRARRHAARRAARRRASTRASRGCGRTSSGRSRPFWRALVSRRSGRVPARSTAWRSRRSTARSTRCARR